MKIRNIAQDSSSVERARARLEKIFQQQDKLATPEKMKRVHEAITIDLARHQSAMIPVGKSRTITVEFDRNQHPAEVSKQIFNIKESLATTLSGRNIKKG